MESDLEMLFSSLCTLNGTPQHSQIVTALIEIRKAVEGGPENIQNVNTMLHENSHYLEYLMNTLLHHHKDIVDIALGIFAICVTNKKFSRETLELGIDPWTYKPRMARFFILTLPDSKEEKYHNLPSLLILLLERFKEEESIQAKIIEITLNVCQYCDVTIGRLFSEDDLHLVVTRVEEFMKGVPLDSVFPQLGITEDTLFVVVRFFNRIMNDEDLIGYEDSFGVIRFLGRLFVQSTLDAKKNEKIIKEVVRMLFNIVKYDTYSPTNYTSDEESIMFICGEMCFFAQRISGIMDKYIKIDQFEPQSLLSDVCDWIIQKVEQLHIEAQKDDYVGYITCLCFILLNRCDEQHKKYLPRLIKVLKSIDIPSYADTECFILIITALNKYCRKDAILLKNLLESDLVRIFVEKLKWIAGVKSLSLDFNHQTRQSLRYQYRFEGMRSVGSCNHPNPTFRSDNSWVTTIVPFGQEQIFCDDSYHLSLGFYEFGSRHYHSRHQSPCPCSDYGFIDVMKVRLYRAISDLIKIYIQSYPDMLEVVSEELIVAEMNCLVYYGKSLKITKSISSSPVHLVHLMKTAFIQKVYDIKQKNGYDSECLICARIEKCGRLFEEFGKTAMSEKGKEIITNEVLTSTCEQKSLLVLSITYIISDKFLLAYYLLELDCLSLFAQLLEDDSTLKKSSIKVLRALTSETLRIADPSEANVHELSQVLLPAPTQTNPPPEEAPVTFKLDDDTSVQVDRTLLTKNSKYFSAMFGGNFKESTAGEVTVPNVSSDTLKFVVRVLQYPGTIDRLVEESSTDALLEAIVFADRHLLDDLRGSLVSRVLKHRMTPDSVASIYRRSIELRLDLLKTQAVTFALVRGLDALLEVVCTKDLIADVRAVLETHLRPVRCSLSE